MDDIRRPYKGERADYALPQRPSHRPDPPVTDLRPQPAQPAPQPQPQHQPHHNAHHQAHHAQHHTAAAQPAYLPQVPAIEQQPEPVLHRPQPAAHQPARAKRRLSSLVLPAIAVIILAAAAAAGGYFLLKPHKAPTFTPSTLAQKASFPFYYPNPLPNGYTYVTTINAIDNGQAYFMLASGKKHIIIHEQAATGSHLDTTNLQNPVSFTATSGQAAIGITSGQQAGILLTRTTLISLNSTGQVTPADMSAVIDALKPTAR